jgi:hypothetical protein
MMGRRPRGAAFPEVVIVVGVVAAANAIYFGLKRDVVPLVACLIAIAGLVGIWLALPRG